MLAKNLKKIAIKKENLGLDLVELEAAAKLVLEEASDVSGNSYFHPCIQFVSFLSPPFKILSKKKIKNIYKNELVKISSIRTNW